MGAITWYSALCSRAFVCCPRCGEGCSVNCRAQHLFWECIELCIKCNRAAQPQRLIPSVRGSGCVGRNSSKYGPKGLCASPPSYPSTPSPPFVSPFATSLSYCCEVGGARGKSWAPQRRGWGLVGQSINGDSIREMTQWKWRFLGMFHARMSIRLGLWQGGELQQRGRECGERPARMLLYVLFSLSSMCWGNRALSC